MGLHKDQTSPNLHGVARWVFGNAAARLAATDPTTGVAYVAGDVGGTLKVAVQTDDYSLWLLTSTGPTWQPFCGSGPAGGDLFGSSYPNPVVKNGAITSDKMSLDLATGNFTADGVSISVVNGVITSIQA